MSFLRFIVDGIKELFHGSKLYWSWVGILGLVLVSGVLGYLEQLDQGLIVTGMSDQVSWGAYIANFTFLVGMAASAVLLVVPTYVFENKHAKEVVTLGEGVAVAACTMAMLFVVVDIGRPERALHMLPGIGWLHWPESILAWDVVVLSGYLVMNLSIPMYFLYKRYVGEPPNYKLVYPGVFLSIFWAISIHTVTAFLFSANSGRPFWHTALLGPRFLASAFAAGPLAIILAFRIIDWRTEFKVETATIRFLAVISTIALQVNLFMLFAEIFTEFYSPTAHSASAHYLFEGLGAQAKLVPWIYTAIGMELVALVLLMSKKLRHNLGTLTFACVLAVVGIWIEKGMGLIIPGFVPTPLGEVFEYTPSRVELQVSFGIWALGLLVFTFLAKAAVPIELGQLKAKLKSPVRG